MYTFVHKFLLAELQGIHSTSAAQTSGKREEALDVIVSRPKMNNAPVVLNFGRGPKVQSELVWWNLAPLLVRISMGDLIGGLWH